jgi:hypothetical protein
MHGSRWAVHFAVVIIAGAMITPARGQAAIIAPSRCMNWLSTFSSSARRPPARCRRTSSEGSLRRRDYRVWVNLGHESANIAQTLDFKIE